MFSNGRMNPGLALLTAVYLRKTPVAARRYG